MWCSMLEPHSLAGAAPIDLELVPFRWLQIHTAPRTLHCTLLRSSRSKGSICLLNL